jgi:hypothetical protein
MRGSGGRPRRATFEDSDGSRVAEYFIVPRRKGGFVMFSVQPNLKFSVQPNLKTAQERDVTNEENLAGFRKAALVAVSHDC